MVVINLEELQKLPFHHKKIVEKYDYERESFLIKIKKGEGRVSLDAMIKIFPMLKDVFQKT